MLETTARMGTDMESRKRDFNMTETMNYLGVKPKFFDMQMTFLLKNKAAKAEITLLFNKLPGRGLGKIHTHSRRLSLCSYFEKQKTMARINHPASEQKWMATTMLTRGTEISAFQSAVSQRSKKPTTGSCSQSCPLQPFKRPLRPLGTSRTGCCKKYSNIYAARCCSETERR